MSRQHEILRIEESSQFISALCSHHYSIVSFIDRWRPFKYILWREIFFWVGRGGGGGEQGWRSGESTLLPPMWPGFDCQSQRHMWVEFVFPSTKNRHFQIPFVQSSPSWVKYLFGKHKIFAGNYHPLITRLKHCCLRR